MKPIETAKYYLLNLESTKTLEDITHLRKVLDFKSLCESYIRLHDALADILKNVSTDWYVQHFGKDTTPNNLSSGIAAKIHNQETLERIMVAFRNARDALAEGDGNEIL